MPADLTPAEIQILIDALNDRESVLAASWQKACDANSMAQMTGMCQKLRELRALADKLRAAAA